MQTVSTGYGTDGRISSAGFLHGGAAKNFGYTYFAGTNLLQVLTKPNGMTLTQTYEATRNLLTGMAYHRGSTLVAQRTYTYDILGRPTARNTARQGKVVNDSFTHDTRSELAAATVNGSDYEYAYDNIGNREFAQENDNVSMYESNALNQYTSISENGAAAFVPQFDADGNQTLIKTSTGIWSAAYNAENRPVTFTNSENNTVVECQYDSMGRRAYKKVTVNGSVTLHQRYLYRGYLQIACCDLTRTAHPSLWYITWDPSQPVATRPLAIQINGIWYTYGWDLTKNICELYGTNGYISTSYTYTPFGQVTTTGSVTQPIQWSSEYNVKDLGLIYYNYRHYNSRDGRWNRRDILDENYSANIYTYCKDDSITKYDKLGLLLPNFDREKNITIIDLREYNLKMPIYRGGRTMGDTTMLWPEFETFAACYGNILGLILTFPPAIEVVYYSNHIDRLGNTLEEHEAFHVNSNISYWNWFARTANYYEKEYDSCDDCLRYLNELKNVYIAYKKAAKKVQDDFDLKASHSLLPE